MRIVENNKKVLRKSLKEILPEKKNKKDNNDYIDSCSLLKAIDEGMQAESIEKNVFIKKLLSRIK